MANLFISHSWEYEEDYKNLVSLLKKRGYFDFRNYSIPSDNPVLGNRKEVWDQISNNIQWSSIVILIAGVYASYSGSIKKEIDLARQYNKPILAIIPRGNERTSSLTGYADMIVGWYTESIVNAIRALT